MRNKQNKTNLKLTLLLVSAIFLSVVAKAQTINSIAGASSGYADGYGSAAKFYNPSGVAFDNLGNMYFSDRNNNRIRMMTPNGYVSTIAGNGTAGFGDASGLTAKFDQPTDIAFDPNANCLYVSDLNNNKIRKISLGSSSYVVTSVVSVSKPNGLCYYSSSSSSAGFIYVAEKGKYRIVKIDLSTSTPGIVPVAGGGTAGTSYGYSGDGGTAGSSSLMKQPSAVKTDASGNVYFADQYYNVIRKIYNSSGIIQTIAGSTTSGSGEVDGAANSAKMDGPNGIAIDNATGNLYISDNTGYRIRKLTPETLGSGSAGTTITTYGTMSTIAGAGTGGDGSSASSASIGSTQHLALDNHGDLIIPAGNLIRKIDFDLNITGSNNICYTGSTTLSVPSTVTGLTNTSGALIAWSSSNTSIATIDPASGVVSGVSAGAVTITYQTSDYGTFAVFPMTISGMPTVPAISSMAGSVCPSTTLDFTLSGAPSVPGIWSISAVTPPYTGSDLAVIDEHTGHFVPTAGYSVPGTVTVAYTSTNVCGSTTVTRNVNMLVSTGTITGTTRVCEGSADVALGDLAAGTSTGWSSSNTAVATIDATTGIVTPRAPGDATITYTVNNVCTAASGVNTITVTFTVDPLPNAGAIMGPWEVCEGSTITVNNPLGDELGVWSTTADYAIITSSGNTLTGGIYANVYGFAVGTNDISYTVTNSYGCTAANGWIISVRPRPYAGALPDINVCVGADVHVVNTTGDEDGIWSITFTGTTPGAVLGATSSVGPIYANVHGASTASTTGTNTLSYTVTNAYGCSESVSKVITVNPLPDPGTITETYGRSTICAPHGIYSTLNLSDAVTGGTWSSSNTMVAAVSTSGVVSGTSYLTPGTAIISYSVTNTCGTGYAMYNITAESNPDPGAITPDGGYTSTITRTSPTNIDVHLASSSLGTWNYTVISGTASINLTLTTGTGREVSKGSSTGSGEFDITYTLSNSCATTAAHFTITVAAGRGVVSETGGIEESTSSLKTYPNPTTGVVTLELPEQNDNTELMIFDVSGKVVETKTTNEAKISFDMSGYSKGVYMIQVKSGDHTYTEKVVFQ